MRLAWVVLLVCLLTVWHDPARAELVIAISKSEQRLSVTLDGAEAYRWPVSTGRAGFGTPSGTFRPTRLEPSWYSHKYDNAPMPWSVFFHGGYAVHGTLEVSRLGRAASHGCVRLRPDEAHTLYSLIQREGADRTRITVLDGPLPRVPHIRSDALVATAKPAAVPMPPEKIAQAHRESKRYGADHTSGPRVRRLTRPEPVRQAVRPLHVRPPALRSVAIGDDARVLREREAWLRSLDRRYGIVR